METHLLYNVHRGEGRLAGLNKADAETRLDSKHLSLYIVFLWTSYWVDRSAASRLFE